MYALVYRSSFARSFKKIDGKTQRILLKALEKVAGDPFGVPHVKHLKGTGSEAYRLRVGRWRILYFLIQPDKTIEVIDVFVEKSKADYRKRRF